MLSPALPAAFLSRSLAHRGLHDRAAGVIENSLSAIRAAVARGYGCEIDLQISADGEAMCFHDDDLDRLTEETGPVRARSFDALRSLRLAGAMPQETIPTFAQALSAIGDAPLLVEIKRQADEVGVGKLEARAAELIAAHPGPVAVMSFDPRPIRWFAEHAPQIPRGLVSMDWSRDQAGAPLSPDARKALTDMADFEAAGCAFCSFHWKDLPTPRTSALREAGLPVLCWTTRSPQDDEAARRHADNVTFESYRPDR